jgi:hypothetical protein
MGSRHIWPYSVDLQQRYLCGKKAFYSSILIQTYILQIDYIFGSVLPVLLIIEAPNEAIAFSPLTTSDPHSQFKDRELSDSLKEGYITSSFRRTA